MLAVLIFGAVGHDLSLFLKNWWHIKCSCRCRCDLSQHLESVKFYMWTGGGKRLIKFLKSHYPTVILGPLGSLGARVLRPFNPASDRLFEEARRCDLSFDLVSQLLWKWKCWWILQPSVCLCRVQLAAASVSQTWQPEKNMEDGSEQPDPTDGFFFGLTSIKHSFSAAVGVSIIYHAVHTLVE